MNQCERRNARPQHPITFDIVDGEKLYISSINVSNLNDNEWIVKKVGKSKVGR